MKDVITNEFKLLFGDCLERMSEIADGSVDMILCDLPYGTTACKWDNVVPFEPLWQHYWRVLKKNGAVVLFGGQPFTSILGASQIRDLRYSWVWQKDRPANFAAAKCQPMKYHEDILVFYRNQPAYNPQMIPRTSPRVKQAQKTGVTFKQSFGDLNSKPASIETNPDKYDANEKLPSTILYHPRVQHGLHPTQKPVSLLEYLIKTYTNEGEIILDNTMGSGSTGVAAANTGRRFIGIEKELKYFEICAERLAPNATDLENLEADLFSVAT